jgi:fucose permease
MATVFLVLLFISYITLGLPDSAWGTVWPFMRESLGMPIASAGIFTMVVTACSALSSALMPKISKKVGPGLILAVCSLMTGLGILGVYFAKSFYVIVAIGVLLGVAGGGVDVSVNDFVADHYSSGVMNVTHAMWGVGAFVGPLIVTETMNDSCSWRTGFLVLAIVQLAFALVLFSSLPLWKKKLPPLVNHDVDYVPTAQSKKKAILALVVVAVLYFVYTGIEQIIGAWLNTLLIEKRMFTATLGGACVSCYYGSIMAGRLVFGLFSSKIGNRLTIYIGLGLAVVGAGLFFITTSVSATFVAVIMIGLGFAPFYPCNMHEAKKRFSADMSKKAIGVQVCSACFGILALSPSVGLLIQHVGHETLPIVAMTLILVLVAFTVLINLLTKPKKQLIVEN